MTPRSQVVSAPVHPALRGLVARVTGYSLHGVPAGVHLGLPSRTLTVILTLDDGIEVSWPHTPTASVQRLPSVVSGLSSAPAHIHHDGSQVGVQLDLTPAGSRALFGLPAAALPAAGVLDATEVLRGVEPVRERLASQPTWSARLETVQNQLAATAAERRRATAVPEVSWAWELLCRRHGSLPVTDVARQVGWSPRRLGRAFRGEFGLGPKLAARVLRFERAHRLVGSGARLAEVAAVCGYADQAHLTRDWQQFAGASPTRWLHEDKLAALTREHRSTPGSDAGTFLQDGSSGTGQD